MQHGRAWAVAVAVTAAGMVVSTCAPAEQPWGAEAETWIDTWFVAKSEGIANELSFYDPHVVWEDRTGGHLFTDRDDFVTYAASVLGETDPAENLATYLSAEEAVVRSWWPTWSPPVEMLLRIRVGPTGIEHLVDTASTRAGRIYAPGAVDFDAIDDAAHRWLDFWNGGATSAADLYTSGATVDDTLLGATAVGVTALDDAVADRSWPALGHVELEPLTDDVGEAIMIGPALQSYDVDEIALVVRLDDESCPRRMVVILGWNGERVVWERRMHELLAARSCEPVGAFRHGWWEGLRPPDPIARVFTGVVTDPTTGADVAVANGDDALQAVVAHLLQHFAGAGIGVPRVHEFAFLEYLTKCTAWDGFTTTGPLGATVNICLDRQQICDDEACATIDHHAELMMLHELAHAWLFDHADEAVRRAFTASVGLDEWNDPDDDWSDRAMERAANAIAVGVAGDLGPQGCDDGRYCDVAPGSFELLTGREPVSTGVP